MRQAVHIFRKDARRCRPYIAAVLALTAANAVGGLADFPEAGGASPGLMIADACGALGPPCLWIVWWFTTCAVVREEGPIGDRQFWITRPYSWKSLLAAKLLFPAAFIGLPVWLSDCIILTASGFNPFVLIPGLLLRQCWLAAFLALPFTVAALTRTTRGFVLAGLVCCPGLAVVLIARVQLRYARLGTGFAWAWDPAMWVLPAAGIALALWQYSRRRTGLARAFGVPLAASAAVCTGLLLPHTEPHSDADGGTRFSNVSIQFDPGRGHSFRGGQNGEIYIPVELSGWPRDLVSYNSLVSRNPAGSWTPVTVIVSTPAGDLDGAIGPESDGGDWLVLFAHGQSVPAEAFDLSLPLVIGLYERLGSATLRSDSGWTFVRGFGSLRLQLRRGFGAMGTDLEAHTALTPPGPEIAYKFGDAMVYSGCYPGFVVPLMPTPLTFWPDPVRSCDLLGPPYGPRDPADFTAMRRVATVHRELKIPRIRLADFRVDNP
jgi:hypothetical protein